MFLPQSRNDAFLIHYFRQFIVNRRTSGVRSHEHVLVLLTLTLGGWGSTPPDVVVFLAYLYVGVA